MEELHELYSLSKSHEKYSCIRKPLINIPLHHVILDELHLMHRVIDRLIENLILEVMERDSKEDINKTSRKDKNVYLKKFVKAIYGQKSGTFSGRGCWLRNSSIAKNSIKKFLI